MSTWSYTCYVFTGADIRACFNPVCNKTNGALRRTDIVLMEITTHITRQVTEVYGYWISWMRSPTPPSLRLTLPYVLFQYLHCIVFKNKTLFVICNITHYYVYQVYLIQVIYYDLLLTAISIRNYCYKTSLQLSSGIGEWVYKGR